MARLGLPGEGTGTIARATLRAIESLRPNALLILAGTNDATAAALQGPSARRASLNNAISSLERISSVAKEGGTGARLIATIPGPDTGHAIRSIVLRGRDVANMRFLTQAIRKRAAGWDVDIFDAQRMLADGMGRIRPRYARDALHWTPMAYRQLERELWPRLQGPRCGANGSSDPGPGNGGGFAIARSFNTP